MELPDVQQLAGALDEHDLDAVEATFAAGATSTRGDETSVPHPKPGLLDS